jgi:hypothetical protein
MGQMGSSVMNMLPKGFANVLGQVGGAVKSAASFAYNNTVGAVYNTVSNALTAGIDFVSGGAATKFKTFIGETAAKFSAPGEVPLTGPEVTQGAKDSLVNVDKEIATINAETGTIKPSADKIARTEAQIAAKAETAARKASAAKLGIAPTETIKVANVPNVADVADAASVDDSKGFIDSYKGFKKGIADKKILGTDISIGEAAGVGKDATQVFTAYKYFNPDDVESGFYNPNIGMANALNQSTTNPYTTSSEDASFVNLNNVPSTPDQQASFYARMFGPVGNDPYAAAMNAPGYGFGFEDYITGA